MVGLGGRVDPERLDLPAWAGPVFGIEVALPPEPDDPPAPIFQPLPGFPGVDRDLALVLPDDLPASRVVETIEGAGGALLEGVMIFDLYEGEGVPEGHRSVAFRLRFQSAERTLTDGEVEEAMDAVVDRLREELGVKTRG
jgi:phenylalanyl-tRNA synthetase beta chain